MRHERVSRRLDSSEKFAKAVDGSFEKGYRIDSRWPGSVAMYGAEETMYLRTTTELPTRRIFGRASENIPAGSVVQLTRRRVPEIDGELHPRFAYQVAYGIVPTDDRPTQESGAFDPTSRQPGVTIFTHMNSSIYERTFDGTMSDQEQADGSIGVSKVFEPQSDMVIDWLQAAKVAVPV